MPVTLSEFTVAVGILANAVLSGFVTAIILVINDRLFRRKVEKMFDKIEAKLNGKENDAERSDASG